LQAAAFVDDAALDQSDRVETIRRAARSMAEQALQKLLYDGIKTKDYMGHMGQTLYLDVYVITPSELEELLVKARMDGQQVVRPILNFPGLDEF